MSDLIDIAIMTIFAREMLEGTVIVGQYRTIIQRSPEWDDPERQKQGLKAVNMAALFACILALITIAIVAIPLALLSKNLDPRVVEFIEGLSKLVAAVCVLQLSLKIPKFLGVYPSKKGEDGLTVGLSLKSIRFNVAWNIWREVAECGAFLLPFFLTGEGAKAIPLSGLIGIAVGGLMGALIYVANKQLKNKVWLAAFMAVLLLFLSVGLFVGGAHEFEEIYGETPKVYNIGYERRLQSDDVVHASDDVVHASDDVVHASDDVTSAEHESDEHESDDVVKEEKVLSIWSEKKLPFALLKPFGYSAGRTQLQIACFWGWLTLGICLHIWKFVSSKKLREAQELAAEEKEHPSMVKSLQNQETAGIESDKDIETASGGSDPIDGLDTLTNQEDDAIEAA
jgi:high-affinity iron transporter